METGRAPFHNLKIREFELKYESLLNLVSIGHQTKAPQDRMMTVQQLYESIVYPSRDLGFDEMSLWWSLVKKVLPDSNNIEEILTKKMGEKTTLVQSSIDVPEEPSNNDVGEQELTQPSELGVRKSNPKYVNAI